MAKISYSPLAQRDLEQIGDYIMDELKNPIAALNTVNRIQDAIDKLADFPQMGTPLSARYEDVGNYRFLINAANVKCTATAMKKRRAVRDLTSQPLLSGSLNIDWEHTRSVLYSFSLMGRSVYI